MRGSDKSEEWTEKKQILAAEPGCLTRALHKGELSCVLKTFSQNEHVIIMNYLFSW